MRVTLPLNKFWLIANNTRLYNPKFTVCIYVSVKYFTSVKTSKLPASV